MGALKAAYRRMHDTKLCSPGGFASRAGLILVSFLVAHLAGLREYASILSGTMPQGLFGRAVDQFLAVSYIVLYLGAVVVAPILAIAALVFFALEKGLDRRRASR